MKIKSITLGFENCDVMKIDGKYIGYFVADDIKTSIKRIACNAVNKLDYVKILVIELHKDANKERYAFGIEDDEHKEYTFDRLRKYYDIVDIQIELYDDYETNGEVFTYSYYVNWTGESEYNNAAQKTYLSKCGNLYIVVSDNKDIWDYFDLKEINDKEYMKSYFRML